MELGLEFLIMMKESQLWLIIDCRNYSETFMENTSAMNRIEELSIELCYSLSCVRRLQCTQETWSNESGRTLLDYNYVQECN
jgi:hypothetical protein